MEGIDGDFPQAKARRQHKDNGLEHCQGYVDKNGMWNNGFYCPRWGGPENEYCCANGRERFCCPEPSGPVVGGSPQGQSTVLPTFSSGSNNENTTPPAYSLPIAIGISAGLLVFVIGILLVGCFVCPCCPGRRRRRRHRDSGKKSATAGDGKDIWLMANGAASTRRTLSVSLEAEATSAVIAAQALVPVKSHCGSVAGVCPASPAPSSSTGVTDEPSSLSAAVHLHCGCRWSPSTSRSTVVDVESGAIHGNGSSMLHAVNVGGGGSGCVHSPSAVDHPAWQTELDNLYNCSCENAMLTESLKSGSSGGIRKAAHYKPGDQQHYQLYHSPAGSAQRLQNHGSQPSSGSVSPSPLCLESFRSAMGCNSQLSIATGNPLGLQVGPRPSPRVAALVLPSARSCHSDQTAQSPTDDHLPTSVALHQPSPHRLNMLQTRLQSNCPPLTSSSSPLQRNYGSLIVQPTQSVGSSGGHPSLMDAKAAVHQHQLIMQDAEERKLQRRDSGVLVEDSELPPGDIESSSTAGNSPSTSSFPASAVLPMPPSLAGVERLGRMIVGSR